MYPPKDLEYDRRGVTLYNLDGLGLEHDGEPLDFRDRGHDGCDSILHRFRHNRTDGPKELRDLRNGLVDSPRDIPTGS